MNWTDENRDCVLNRIEVNLASSDPIRVMVELLMDGTHIQTHWDELKVLSFNSGICWMRNRNLLYLYTTLLINELIKKE